MSMELFEPPAQERRDFAQGAQQSTICIPKSTQGEVAVATNRNDISESILLIGVGNEYRSDDGLGVCVAREIRRRLHDGVRVAEQSGEGTSLMASWSGAAHVLVVDAMVSGESAGTLHRLNAIEERIPKHLFNSSSHTFGVAEAIEMARELNELPQSLVLYGIEAESLEPGVGLSESVVRNIPDLLHIIEHEIETLTAHPICLEPLRF